MEFEMIKNLIKIFSRIDRVTKQKDLKYGTLKKIDSENKEKRFSKMDGIFRSYI